MINGSPQQALGVFTPDRDFFIPGFFGSNGLNWNDIDPDQASTTSGNIKFDSKYAYWRYVSCGLQLKLLNASEEDDGWWEAIRVNRQFNGDDWNLTTVGNVTGRTSDGVLAPNGLLNELASDQLVNEKSYSTGLLRDLHRVQFELHPTMHFHDLKQQREEIYMEPGSFTGGSSVQQSVGCAPGRDDVWELYQQCVDFSHDMVYIRIHCRAPGTEGSETRLHVNAQMNQELIFDTDTRESRFMNKSPNAGAGNVAAHASQRRGNGNAATVIMDVS